MPRVAFDVAFCCGGLPIINRNLACKTPQFLAFVDKCATQALQALFWRYADSPMLLVAFCCSSLFGVLRDCLAIVFDGI
jgi:hypothetical protein